MKNTDKNIAVLNEQNNPIIEITLQKISRAKQELTAEQQNYLEEQVEERYYEEKYGRIE